MDKKGKSSGSCWDKWVEEALSRLQSLNSTYSMRLIQLPNPLPTLHDFEVFHHLTPWDRSAVEIKVSEPTFHNWVHGIPSCGDEGVCGNGLDDEIFGTSNQKTRDLLLFCGNDYLGLGSHPAIRKAAAEAAQEYGMGPRGSSVICGYTNYHRLLESCLADLTKKEEMSALSSADEKPLRDERVAIFSDAFNHASVIDGIHQAQRRGCDENFVYRHCDMPHLDQLLSSCTLEKNVVVTDSIFNMDGDIAPIAELVKLRKKHGFLLVIDDAHGTFVFGKNGGGLAEEFNCESDVDICVSGLSKGRGSLGGFIACRKMWKQLILSRDRSFVFTTTVPVPVVAANIAAIAVAKKETWRRRTALWERVRDFRALTGIPVESPIISLIAGSDDKAMKASQHLLKSGFHVSQIRPPAVPPNLCRLRVTLSSAHTTEDVKKLVVALSECVDLSQIISVCNSRGRASL